MSNITSSNITWSANVQHLAAVDALHWGVTTIFLVSWAAFSTYFISKVIGGVNREDDQNTDDIIRSIRSYRGKIMSERSTARESARKAMSNNLLSRLAVRMRDDVRSVLSSWVLCPCHSVFLVA